MHIKENPKASTRCDGQSLSFLLCQNAGYLFTCRLPLDKSCNIKNGVYYEKRYCCGEVSAPVCKPKIQDVPCTVNSFAGFDFKCVHNDPFGIGF